jgi:hypothetical protein
MAFFVGRLVLISKQFVEIGQIVIAHGTDKQDCEDDDHRPIACSYVGFEPLSNSKVRRDFCVGIDVHAAEGFGLMFLDVHNSLLG